MAAERAGRLILVSGLPGSGKTTLAHQLERDRPAVRYCPDERLDALAIDRFDATARARVEELQWQGARRLLELGVTVVLEWGLWSRAERAAVRERADEVGAAVELRFLDAPLEVLWSRVRERDLAQRPEGRALTLADLERFEAMLERPDAAELAGFDPPAAPGTGR